MKHLLTLTLCFQCIWSYAQTGFLIDVVHTDTLYYSPKNNDSFVNEHIDKYQDIDFRIFHIIDSEANETMVDHIIPYFNEIHNTDSIRNILQEEQNVIDSTLGNAFQQHTFRVEEIILEPLSYLNHHIFFQYSVNYTVTSVEDMDDMIQLNKYYTYNTITGEIQDQNEILHGVNSKKLFKALKKQWKVLCTQLQFDKNSSYIDVSYLNPDMESNDSTNISEIVLPQIDSALIKQNLNQVDLYWTGAGIMVSLKHVLFSYKHRRFNEVNIHLDVKDIPGSCFKQGVIPKSFPKHVQGSKTSGFKSLLSIYPLEKYFDESHVNLLKIENKDIEGMDMTFKQYETSDPQLMWRSFYDKGQLVKRTTNPGYEEYRIDSVLWEKDKFIGYVVTQVKDSIRKTAALSRYILDKQDNITAQCYADNNIRIKRSVFMGDVIASFTYDVFSSQNSRQDLSVNWYSKNSKGWTYTISQNMKPQIYMTKDAGPHILNERTFLYNSRGQIVQDWHERYSFILYGYDKQNRLNEVTHRSSGSSVLYKYEYNTSSDLTAILKQNKKGKAWMRYTFHWK